MNLSALEVESFTTTIDKSSVKAGAAISTIACPSVITLITKVGCDSSSSSSSSSSSEATGGGDLPGPVDDAPIIA